MHENIYQVSPIKALHGTMGLFNVSKQSQDIFKEVKNLTYFKSNISSETFVHFCNIKKNKLGNIKYRKFLH
jgi:hypothetical protein